MSVSTGKLLLRRRSRQLLKRLLGKAPRPDAAHAAEGMVSYAQQGEDMILQCLFQGHRTGFYVDVGAHHPAHYSNTYFFYLRGWRGINIDAMPGSMDAFRASRPEDINVECAIAETPSTRTYYEFDEPAVNGFSRAQSESRGAGGHFRLIGRREIPTRTLAEVLDRHLPPGQQIDFLSVDVEGLDLEVLRSNDWSRFRPKVIVTEDTDAHLIDDVKGSGVVHFLRGHGYLPSAKCVHSILLVDDSQFEPRQDGFFRAGG